LGTKKRGFSPVFHGIGDGEGSLVGRERGSPLLPARVQAKAKKSENLTPTKPSHNHQEKKMSRVHHRLSVLEGHIQPAASQGGDLSPALTSASGVKSPDDIVIVK